MRVLCFTIGPAAEPSSRYRIHQLVPWLRSAGIEIEVRPLASLRYFELGYGLRRVPAPLRASWVAAHFGLRALRRLRDLIAARRRDVLVIQKELLPFGLERLIERWRIPLLFDFDDAIYARSPLEDGRGRRIAKLADRVLDRERGLAALLSRSSVVLAGNPTLARYARRFAADVEVVPTVVDLAAYPLRPPPARAGPVTLGWFGAPPNRTYLEPLRGILAAVAREHPIRFVAAGLEHFACPGVPVQARPWRHYRCEAELAADLREFDIGIMPLPRHPLAEGKCALKAIQYMACGIPVVASPVGMARDVVVHGETGFLAETPAEWREALLRLARDPHLRERMGRAGRERVRSCYTLERVIPAWLRALRRAARRAGQDVVRPSSAAPMRRPLPRAGAAGARPPRPSPPPPG